MGRVRRTREGVVLASVLLVVASVSVVASVTTGSAGAAATSLDNFECYAASSPATAKVPKPFPNTPKKISLKSSASGAFVASIGAVQMHCDPTRKTVVVGGHSVTSAITNAKAHLLCSTVKQNALKLPPVLTVKNQFGTSVLKPTAARSLCLPSWNTPTTTPSFPAANAPPNLATFACFTVVHPVGTPGFKPPASVHLQDQFDNGKTSVGAANMLCLPSATAPNGSTAWTSIVSPTQYSVCFVIPPGPNTGTRTIYDKNRFGVGAVKLVHKSELCLPSVKVGPTTTTTAAPTTTTTIPGTLIPVTSYTDPSIKDPIDITTGPDGALWFTNAANNTIGRITTAGVVTNFADPSIGSPNGITAGPDGALWFVNSSANTIGRITTAGAVTHFADASIKQPFDIVAGPDGALWFTNFASKAIGRITAAGVVTKFSSANMTFVSSPDGIAAGPDGALWYANTGYFVISRITTTGVITGFTASSVARPYRVTAGPDSAMWFTNSGNNSVGRITTDGTITNYPDATISDPHGIVTGPDGALWFANSGNSTIGRVTTAGAVTDFNNPAISLPDSITVGPDNALWFTNPGNNTIGRIAP
jgi:virginiamycin B lyase